MSLAYNRDIGKGWSQIFHNARKNQKRRPEWIRTDLWPKLLKHWNKKDYLEKCKKASQNRKKGPHLTHGRGTKSTDTIAEEISQENDGVRPYVITVLEISKSKPPHKGFVPGT